MRAGALIGSRGTAHAIAFCVLRFIVSVAPARNISEKTMTTRPPLPVCSGCGRRDTNHNLGIAAGGDEPRDESDEACTGERYGLVATAALTSGGIGGARDRHASKDGSSTQQRVGQRAVWPSRTARRAAESACVS